jgi:hypothetical protein
VSESQGSLTANWNCRPETVWSALVWISDLPPHRDMQTDPAKLDVSYSLSSKPSVDPLTNQVTFPDSGSVSVTPDVPGWLAPLFSQFAIPGWFTDGMQQSLRGMFDSFQLPSVDSLEHRRIHLHCAFDGYCFHH